MLIIYDDLTSEYVNAVENVDLGVAVTEVMKS
jgi:hypothetical protein